MNAPARTRIRGRRHTASAVAIALAAGGAMMLTGCGPSHPAKAGATAASPAAGATGPAAPAASGSPSAPPVPVGATTSVPTTSTPSKPKPTRKAPAPNGNGPGTKGLTISNGTSRVVIDGTAVDFGTAVRDLVWSPDGKKAAFIDGSGNLDTANPDGSGRVTVARNPGGQNWSHPTWQLTPADSSVGDAARDNLFFASTRNGTSTLEVIAATARDGAPKALTLPGENGAGGKQVPQTGNSWPSTAGSKGDSVYQNSNGQFYVRDDYIRTQAGVVGPGSEPAMSPDGNSVVFVRSVDGHDHLFEMNVEVDRIARDLTPGATTDYTEPAWSADGHTVAARTAKGIYTLPASGSAAPTWVSGSTGLPAYRA